MGEIAWELDVGFVESVILQGRVVLSDQEKILILA
jgi:hypothetical protein